MPFDELTPRPFTRHAVRTFAPNTSGVYGISNAREWLYVGETGNIQAALLDHLQDLNTSLGKRQPTGFVFEVCDGPSRSSRQDRLILEYAPVFNPLSSRYS
jgi:hypothetical protein